MRAERRECEIEGDDQVYHYRDPRCQVSSADPERITCGGNIHQ